MYGCYLKRDKFEDSDAEGRGANEPKIKICAKNMETIKGIAYKKEEEFPKSTSNEKNGK